MGHPPPHQREPNLQVGCEHDEVGGEAGANSVIDAEDASWGRRRHLQRAQLTRAVSELLAFSEEKEIPQKAVLVDVDPLSLF